MKALIVDDEPMAAKHLQFLIEQHCFEITSTHLIHSPIAAIKHLRTHQYDLIFLDVEMPEISGVELLKQVMLPRQTQVIFTTAHAQYAIDAFQADAAHYLLKVIQKDKLILAVRKVSNNSAPTPAPEDLAISVFQNDEHHILRAKDILRFQAQGSYTSILLPQQKFLSSKGIGHFEKKLRGSSFFRCHNSHLINLQKVVKIGKGKSGYVVLSNEEVIPVSNAKKEELERRMGI